MTMLQMSMKELSLFQQKAYNLLLQVNHKLQKRFILMMMPKLFHMVLHPLNLPLIPNSIPNQ